MQFGLMELGTTFQRTMNNIPANVSNVKCYIDDLFIYSVTEEEHMVHFDTRLKLLKKNVLRLRLKKCFSMQICVELLSHYIDRDGLHVDDVKVEEIRKAARLSTRKELCFFLRR